MIDPWETNGGHPQIPGSGSYSLPLDEVLLSQMLKTHGYATHIVTIPRPTILCSLPSVGHLTICFGAHLLCTVRSENGEFRHPVEKRRMCWIQIWAAMPHLPCVYGRA